MAEKKLIERLGGDADGANVSTTPETIGARREGLVHTLPMLMEVDLGTANLKLSELSNLHVGDVIMLDQRLEDEVVARMGGRDLFRGRPGRIGSRIALRIDSMEES